MTDQEIIERFEKVARPLMLAVMTPRSCIGASRVTWDVLRSFGMKVEPMSMTFVVSAPSLNVTYVTGLRGEDRDRAQRYAKDWVDLHPSSAGFDGHVVCIANDKWLVDASFDQISTGGIAIEPTVLVLDLEALLGPVKPRDACIIGHGFSGDCAIKIQYQPLDDDSFLRSEAWGDEGLTAVTMAILREMRKSTAPAAKICDFCLRPSATGFWVFPVGEIAGPMRQLLVAGDWAACPVCRWFVTTRDAGGLARCVFTLNPEIDYEVARLSYTLLLAHITGEPYVWIP